MAGFEKRGKKLHEKSPVLDWYRGRRLDDILRYRSLSGYPLSERRGNHCERLSGKLSGWGCF